MTSFKHVVCKHKKFQHYQKMSVSTLKNLQRSQSQLIKQ